MAILPSPPPSPNHRGDVSDLLIDVMQLLSGHIEAAASESGLTPMQAMLLQSLESRQQVPMSEIARKLHCDTSNVTGLVDRLEHRELIVRTTPANDRRVRAVELTPLGEDVRAEVVQRIRDDNPALAHLTAPEITDLLALLRRILGRTPPVD